MYGPLQLLRRLRQIGVADEDKGQQLAVGQRLVTRDGNSAALGRLRLDRVGRGGRRAADPRQPAGGSQQATAALEQAVEGASAARDQAAGDVERWRAEGDEQRKAASAAEREVREAERAADAAAAAIDRLNAQREAVSAAGGRS